jgi:large subunit ribosomal protein L10
MRPEKQSIINEYSEALKATEFVLMGDYRGVTVEQFAALRAELRATGSSVQVVKNELLALALKSTGQESLTEHIAGPTVMISGQGDVTVLAKQLKAFNKENKVLEMTCGEIDGSLLSSADISALAEIPAREVLLSMFVGTVAAPMSQLVGVMNQKISSLLYVLKAVEEKKNS